MSSLLDGDINKFIFYCLSWQTCQKLCQVHLGNDQNWAFFCRSVAHWKFWPNFLSYNYSFSPRNVRGLKRSKIKWKNESVQLMHCYLTRFEQSGKNWGKQYRKVTYWPFEKKQIFWLVTPVNVRDFTGYFCWFLKFFFSTLLNFGCISARDLRETIESGPLYITDLFQIL